MSGTTVPTLMPATSTATEDEVLVSTGNILANDVDNNGRTLGVVSVNGIAINGSTTIAGVYGTLVIQPNGSYTYTLANTAAKVRALQNGQTLPDLFTTVVSDGQTYTQTITTTVQNLIPQSEAFNDSTWVKFTAGGSAASVTANTGAGPNGGSSTADTLTFNSQGSGLYFQTGVSGSYTLSVWVRVLSGSAGFALGTYSGSANAVTTQAFTATTTWQRFTFSFTGDGNGYSNVSIGLGAGQSSGGALQLWGAQLNSGSTAQSYVPTTGSPASATVAQSTPVVLSSTLTVNVIGNTPVANPDSGSVVANGQTVSSGNVLSNDTDGAGKTLAVASVNGATVSGSTTVVGTYGTLVIQASGAYTYTLSNNQAVQALATGQVVQDKFTYAVADGQSYLQTSTSQNLILYSEAFDDPSWVPFGNSSVVTANADPGPNGGASTADRIAFNTGSGLYFQTAASGQLTFSVWVRLISGSGSFAFDYYSGAANTVSLQTATATSSWQRLSWTFTGDGNVYSNVALLRSSSQTSAGTLEFWGAQLNPGATAQTYVATSGNPVSVSAPTNTPSVIGSTLSISVTGAQSSSPPVAAPDTASVTEDSGAGQAATGNVLSNDTVFGGRTLSVLSVNGVTVSGPTTVTGSDGTLAIQSNGSYTYTLNNAQANVRALTNGQTALDVFSYTLTDGLTSTKTTTQTKQNLISQSEAFGSSVWTLFSATGLPATTLTTNITPGPTGGGSTAAQLDLLGPTTGLYYTTNVSGQFTFSIWVRLVSGNPNYSFNYYSNSGGPGGLQSAVATSSWQRMSWTFTGDGSGGSNVALMHGPFQTGDTVLEISGAQLNTGSSAGTYVPTTGTTVNTSSTATVPIGSALTVSVTGVTPVAGAGSGTVTAGSATTATGNLLASATDANGLPLTLASVQGIAINGPTTITGAYGTLAVQPNGQYTYTLASTQPTVQAISGSQTALDSFSFTVSDGQVHTAIVNQVSENLITQSEAFNAAPWTPFSPGALPAVTANVDSGPQGGAATADQVVLTTQGAGLAYATPVAGPYTFSVWVKLVSGAGAFTFNYLETTAGANFAQTATATSAWQRFVFTFTGDGNANSGIALELGATQAGGTFEFWGAQLNAGTTADSYIATTGSAGTTSTPITSPAPTGSTLSVTVTGTDTGKPGPALDFQASTRGVVANLATGVWSNATTAMPLGDSITYGWSAADAQVQSFTSEGYRGPLWSTFLANNNLLDLVGENSNGPPVLLDPFDSAYPGERSDQIAARLPGLLATQHPDDVLLMAGINDLKQGFSAASVDSNIAGMISTIGSTSPATRVYVALITPVSAATASASAVAAANAGIKTDIQNAVASGIKATLIDTSDLTIADISADGTHPAPGGYAKIAADYYAAITAAQRITAGTPGGAVNTISPTVTSLVGSSGNDLLIGDSRPNFITAGSGNDILIGGGGNDVLTGGTGADEFVFTAAAGLVTVNGFNPNKGDFLDWNIASVTSAASLSGHVTQSAGSTVVDLSSYVPNLKITLASYTGDLSHSIFGPPAG